MLAAVQRNTKTNPETGTPQPFCMGEALNPHALSIWTRKPF